MKMKIVEPLLWLRTMIGLGVERVLCMCPTAVNVTGGLTAVTIMDRWLGKSKQQTVAAQEENSVPSPNATT
jgi:Na+/H+-dicarboxylate symporter